MANFLLLLCSQYAQQNTRTKNLRAHADPRALAPWLQEHQVAVIDCLEDQDDTLKLKTLALLYTMTKASNVAVITERMMMFLKVTSDVHIKRDIVHKVLTCYNCWIVAYCFRTAIVYFSTGPRSSPTVSPCQGVRPPLPWGHNTRMQED